MFNLLMLSPQPNKVLRKMKNRMGCKSKIVPTAKDFEKTLLDFEYVGCVCLDCKSNIVSTANKEQEKWVFPIGEEKKKKQKTKTKTKNKHLSEEGTVHSCSKTH